MRKTGVILPVHSEFTGAAGMDAKTGQRGQQEGELELCPVHKVKAPGKSLRASVPMQPALWKGPRTRHV